MVWWIGVWWMLDGWRCDCKMMVWDDGQGVSKVWWCWGVLHVLDVSEWWWWVMLRVIDKYVLSMMIDWQICSNVTNMYQICWFTYKYVTNRSVEGQIGLARLGPAKYTAPYLTSTAPYLTPRAQLYGSSNSHCHSHSSSSPGNSSGFLQQLAMANAIAARLEGYSLCQSC
jgi:hypothetical protein